MKNAEIKFNSVKTIKLINKTPILKNIYIEIEKGYEYNNLKDNAINDKLSLSETTTLKTIFSSLIAKKEVYAKQYDKISLIDGTPRRYGKVQIENEIINQNGETNELQKTMLALNDLKSMGMNLISKGTSDRYKNTNNLSEENGKAIRAAIRTFRKQMQDILKPKK